MYEINMNVQSGGVPPSRPQPNSRTFETQGTASDRSSTVRGSTGTEQDRFEPQQTPDLAAQVLDEVALRSQELPPEDLARITAAATRFLLTNLEPAMEVARAIREDALSRSEHAISMFTASGSSAEHLLVGA